MYNFFCYCLVIIRIRLFGDPHITTLFGKTYTFNGLGEYYLIYIPGELIVQSRFVQARKSDGTLTQATIAAALVVFDSISNNTVRLQHFLIKFKLFCFILAFCVLRAEI